MWAGSVPVTASYCNSITGARRPDKRRRTKAFYRDKRRERLPLPDGVLVVCRHVNVGSLTTRKGDCQGWKSSDKKITPQKIWKPRMSLTGKLTKILEMYDASTARKYNNF